MVAVVKATDDQTPTRHRQRSKAALVSVGEVLDDITAEHGDAEVPEETAAAIVTLTTALIAANDRKAATAWAEIIGPALTPGAATKLLAISSPALDKRRNKNAVLGFQTSNRRWVYPVRQFTVVNGRIEAHPNLRPALEILIPAAGPNAATRWMGTPNRRLRGRTPWEVLPNDHEQHRLLAAATAQLEAWGAGG